MNLPKLKPLPLPILAPPGKEAFVAAGANCAGCPLAKNRAVRSELGRNATPTLALIGEAPGKREVAVGRPFVGKSGELLNYALKQAGIARADIAVLNAIACGPIASDNEIVKHAAMRACRPRLLAELRALQPKGLLAIGAKALAALAPEGSSGVTALRGALLSLADDVPTEEWKPPFFSTFHPAHIMRGGDGDNDGPEGEDTSSVDLLYYFLLFDLAKAYQFANGQIKGWEDDLDLFVDQGGDLHRVTVTDGEPTIGEQASESELLDALNRVVEEARTHGELTCDVETDGKDSLEANLTAISYGTPLGAVSATWASWQMFPSVRARLTQLHADRTQRWNWQNGIFDRVVLRRHKLAIAGPSEDTLLKHHGAFPGLPHKLDQVAAQFFVTAPWKNEFRTSTRNLAELVLYNGRDVVATAKISPAVNRFLKETRTERVYEADRQINVVATRMREVGMYIDRVEQERHRKVQTARLEYMREALGRDFAAIEEDWRQALARLLADKQRKKDPEAYLERVDLRYREIAERDKKPTDIGFFKPKAKADIVALFTILRIPFTDYTAKGAPVTDKKAMEGAAARHPLMRRLIHIREAQHLIATYIDLPIKRDGRMHPDWKTTKITGRWGAGKSQNVPNNVAGWPPEEVEDETKPPPQVVKGNAPNAILIDRTTKWGNPFVIGRDGVREEVIAKYDRWLDGRPDLLAALPELRGWNLRCHCVPQPCHGDVLLRRANVGDGCGPRPGYKWKTNALGSFITPRENMRSIITAPTAEQVLAIARQAPGTVNPWVLARARKGFGRILVGADMDQVELRILAFLSKDPFLLGIFNEGRDPHSEFSHYIFPDHFPKLIEEIKAAGFKPKGSDAVEDEIARLEGRDDDIARARVEKLRLILKAQKRWKRLRDFTKRVEYGGAYRGKALTIWTALVKDMPEVELSNVEHGINVFYEKAAMVPRWHNDQEVRARLYRESREALLGRVRLFPLGNFSPTVVVNFPIQSYGASLLALAIFRFTALTHPELLEFDRLYKFGLLDARWVRDMKAKGFGTWKAPVELISNGHDSLLVEADVEEGARAAELLAKAMTQEVTDRDGTRMVYSAEAKVSQRWSHT